MTQKFRVKTKDGWVWRELPLKVENKKKRHFNRQVDARIKSKRH